MGSVGPLVVGLIPLVVSVLSLYYAYWQFGRYRLISRSDVSSPTDVSEGQIELEGSIEGADSRVDVTVTDAEEPVVSGWRVKQWDESGDSSNWKTKGKGVFAVPFTLSTSEGAITVDPPTASPDDGSDEEEYYDPHGSASPSPLSVLKPDLSADSLPLPFVSPDPSGVFTDYIVCEFEEYPHLDVPASADRPDRLDTFDTYAPGVFQQPEPMEFVDVGKSSGDRHYYEGTLEVGDDVYVNGYATPKDGVENPSGPDDFVVTGDPAAEDPFVISDMDESTLAAKRRNRALLGGVAGGFLLLLAVPLVLLGIVVLLL